MNLLIQKIREALKENIDEKTQKNSQRFFKEEVKCYGASTAICRKIASQFWKEVKTFKKQELFDLCESLFSSDYCEEAFMQVFGFLKLPLNLNRMIGLYLKTG